MKFLEDLGDSGISSNSNFLIKIINEIKIRFNNGQNIFELNIYFLRKVNYENI